MSGFPSEKMVPAGVSWIQFHKPGAERITLEFCQWLQQEEIFDMFVEHPELARVSVAKSQK